MRGHSRLEHDSGMNVFDWKQEIDNHYPADRKVRGILIAHSRSVAILALEIAHRLELPLDDDDIVAAAMLHDLGIIATCACGRAAYRRGTYGRRDCRGGYAFARRPLLHAGDCSGTACLLCRLFLFQEQGHEPAEHGACGNFHEPLRPRSSGEIQGTCQGIRRGWG